MTATLWTHFCWKCKKIYLQLQIWLAPLASLTPKLIFALTNITIILIAVLYRGLLISHFNATYIDDDQALMRLGAVAAKNFFFPEPDFWGQAYGSMFEADIAALFNTLGMSLTKALPWATICLSLLPFAIISWYLYRQGDYLSSSLVCLLYLCAAWQWDFLTSLPRSFISGFPLATLSAIWLNQKHQSTRAIFLAAFGGIYAVSMTNTAAFIVMVSLLFFIFGAKRTVKEITACFTGLLAGALVYFFKHFFYVIHPDYNLHSSPRISFDLSVWQTNMKNLAAIFDDFIFVHHGAILILLFGLLVICLFISKKWQTLNLTLATLLSTLLFMSVPKTLNFQELTILYSRTRLYLYLSYTWIVIYYYHCLYYHRKVYQRRTWLNCAVAMSMIILALCLSYSKYRLFANLFYNQDEEIFAATPTNLYALQPLIDAAQQIDRYAREHQVDAVIFLTDVRALGYLLEAEHYRDSYLVYNAVYDRRTWTYHELSRPKKRRCLLVTYRNSPDIDYQIADLNGESVVAYLARVYNLQRIPNRL